MVQAIELWDSESANLIGTFDSVDSAISDLARLLGEGDSIDWVNRVVLTFEDSDLEEPVILAQGGAILELSRIAPAVEVSATGRPGSHVFGVMSIVGRESPGAEQRVSIDSGAHGRDAYPEAQGHVGRVAVAS